VAYYLRRFFGKSGERHINQNLPQLFTFDDIELTEAEQQATEKAVREIETFREQSKKVTLKTKPVRKTLLEHLPRREEHIFPEIAEIDNREVYDELPPDLG
jgi:hemerythrin superfamily protein